METITKLKKWLKQDGNSELKLASILGYESPYTIKSWIKNNRIPSFQETNVLRAIKGAINVTIESNSTQKK